MKFIGISLTLNRLALPCTHPKFVYIVQKCVYTQVKHRISSHRNNVKFRKQVKKGVNRRNVRNDIRLNYDDVVSQTTNHNDS